MSIFGALMLFASIKESTKLDTAATDGRDIFFNKKFLESLTSSEQNALMLHEVLHMALLHVQRRQSRDPYIWNIAADIVVNDLINETHLLNCLRERLLIMHIVINLLNISTKLC